MSWVVLHIDYVQVLSRCPWPWGEGGGKCGRQECWIVVVIGDNTNKKTKCPEGGQQGTVKSTRTNTLTPTGVWQRRVPMLLSQQSLLSLNSYSTDKLPYIIMWESSILWVCSDQLLVWPSQGVVNSLRGMEQHRSAENARRWEKRGENEQRFGHPWAGLLLSTLRYC